MIRVTDGNGWLHECKITSFENRVCHFVISTSQSMPKPGYRIHIGVAPTKSTDRIEWFVEKATEIGIDEITFFQSHNSERKDINIGRVIKKALSAMKQSQRVWLPLINPVTNLKSLMDVAGKKYIAHVDPTNEQLLKNVARNSSYTVLIGPEGDFTAEEISMAQSFGFQMINLGNSVMRTETAALVACHTLNLIHQ